MKEKDMQMAGEYDLWRNVESPPSKTHPFLGAGGRSRLSLRDIWLAGQFFHKQLLHDDDRPEAKDLVSGNASGWN